ncbi:MAG: lysophospholipid acyltransferase family protein [Bilifractor sp.]|jgi:1-acyl-sn-glycerol-3-phosphate acyltransferase
MLRFILLILIAILYLIITLPVLLVLWIMHKINPDRAEKITSAMIRWIFGVLTGGGGVKTTVIGQEKIPTETPVLFIGNHRSIFDIMISYQYLPKRITGYVAKETLGKIPLFSLWAKYISCLFFSREDPKSGIQMIRDAAGHLKAGKSVFIFPEGTRNKQKEDLPLLPFHEGSLRIASMADVPIVPVAQNNTVNIWEAHFPKVRPTHTVLEFCDPIYPKDLPKPERKHIGEKASAIMTETIKRNQDLL